MPSETVAELGIVGYRAECGTALGANQVCPWRSRNVFPTEPLADSALSDHLAVRHQNHPHAFGYVVPVSRDQLEQPAPAG